MVELATLLRALIAVPSAGGEAPLALELDMAVRALRVAVIDVGAGNEADGGLSAAQARRLQAPLAGMLALADRAAQALLAQEARAYAHALRDAGGALAARLDEITARALAIAPAPDSQAPTPRPDPSAGEAQVQGEPPSAAPGLARAAHVLVVDDNPTNRLVAQTLCGIYGASSEVARDGVEAVEMVTSGAFDLVLMDIRMPRMDGVQATRAIRDLAGPAGRLPIIAVTANADSAAAAEYLAAGMQAVIEKPIQSKLLLAAMREALDGRAQGQAAQEPEAAPFRRHAGAP